MVTVQAKLKFSNKKDKQAVLNLMRRWSACMRFTYNRLLENKDRNTLKRELQKLFNLNSRYVDDAITKANATLKSCKELKINPKSIIFGTKKLFQKLKKKHLDEHKRKKLKEEWIEKRHGTLYSRGDKSKQGNLNLRIEQREEKFYLRINVGDRTYVYAEIIRKVTRDTDKWIDFIWRLQESQKTGEFFSYTVELKRKNGEIYVFISYEEDLPELKITEINGVIGIDINASPLHIAWAETGSDGNLLSYGRISLHELLGVSKEKRDYLLWHIVHAIINLAIEKNKAIVIEKMEKLPLGTKGDGMKKLRKRLHQDQASGWNKPVRGEVASPIPWQVVSVATVMPLLGKVFVRDYAPLKGVLVSGEWERLAGALRPGLRLRQAPVPGAGAMDTPNSACVGLEYPESGGLQISTPELCEFAQFS